MPSQDEISTQQHLLITYRQTLRHYLRQRAALGIGNTPPNIENGIVEARDNISNIKIVLRSWNIDVEDLPSDTEISITPGDNSVVTPIPSLKSNVSLKLLALVVAMFIVGILLLANIIVPNLISNFLLGTKIHAQQFASSFAMPEPTPAIFLDTVISYDNFDNPSQSSFDAVDYKNMRISFINNSFVLTSTSEEGIIWSLAKNHTFYDNFSLESDVIFNSKARQAACFLLRYQDNGNFYIVDIFGSGRYRILKQQDDKWSFLAQEASINNLYEPGIVNQVRIDLKGPLLILYVNGKYVTSVEDQSFKQGEIALGVTQDSSEDARIIYDNLFLRRVK